MRPTMRPAGRTERPPPNCPTVVGGRRRSSTPRSATTTPPPTDTPSRPSIRVDRTTTPSTQIRTLAQQPTSRTRRHHHRNNPPARPAAAAARRGWAPLLRRRGPSSTDPGRIIQRTTCAAMRNSNSCNSADGASDGKYQYIPTTSSISFGHHPAAATSRPRFAAAAHPSPGYSPR